MKEKRGFCWLLLFSKKPKVEYESITIYQTEADRKEFSNFIFAEAKQQEQERKKYSRRLMFGSEILALMICSFLIGVCYWQWRIPPVYTQYEENFLEDAPQQPLAVDVENEGLFASITIEVCDYKNLAEAILLINGEESGSFLDKQLVVRVYPGDLLEIDTSAYLEPCRFRIVKKSSHIREDLIVEEIITEQGYGWIGKIVFK